MSLLPCPSCGRHVRRSESVCPFCAASVSFEGVPQRGVPAQRLGRAATFAFGAAAATAVGASALTGCTAAPAYGGPPGDAGVDSSLPEDAFVGGIDAAYGGPPADAGPPEDSHVGGFDAAYGGPPADAGNTEDSGGGGALYGAPPP